MNVAVATAVGVAADELQRSAALAREWAAEQAVPWLFVVTEEAIRPDVKAAAVLDACGFVPAMALTGMAAQRVLPAARAASALQLAAAADEPTRAALVDVNTHAYGMDMSPVKSLLTRQEFWEGHVSVVGWVEGRAVSSAAVFMVGGYRYVALVATDPDQQRRGYAEAAMRRALDEAERVRPGLPTFLHATEAGRPVYERMGYVAIAHHAAYIDEAMHA
jgi:GNAT superfamily N-acetyltransferase